MLPFEMLLAAALLIQPPDTTESSPPLELFPVVRVRPQTVCGRNVDHVHGLPFCRARMKSYCAW